MLFGAWVRDLWCGFRLLLTQRAGSAVRCAGEDLLKALAKEEGGRLAAALKR